MSGRGWGGSRRVRPCLFCLSVLESRSPWDLIFSLPPFIFFGGGRCQKPPISSIPAAFSSASQPSRPKCRTHSEDSLPCLPSLAVPNARRLSGISSCPRCSGEVEAWREQREEGREDRVGRCDRCLWILHFKGSLLQTVTNDQYRLHFNAREASSCFRGGKKKTPASSNNSFYPNHWELIVRQCSAFYVPWLCFTGFYSPTSEFSGINMRIVSVLWRKQSIMARKWKIKLPKPLRDFLTLKWWF